jgi:hypothetical protein
MLIVNKMNRYLVISSFEQRCQNKLPSKTLVIEKRKGILLMNSILLSQSNLGGVSNGKEKKANYQLWLSSG